MMILQNDYLPDDAPVTIAVFVILTVDSVVNGKSRDWQFRSMLSTTAGPLQYLYSNLRVEWNGCDGERRSDSSGLGLYIYRL